MEPTFERSEGNNEKCKWEKCVLYGRWLWLPCRKINYRKGQHMSGEERSWTYKDGGQKRVGWEGGLWGKAWMSWRSGSGNSIGEGLPGRGNSHSDSSGVWHDTRRARGWVAGEEWVQGQEVKMRSKWLRDFGRLYNGSQRCSHPNPQKLYVTWHGQKDF